MGHDVDSVVAEQLTGAEDITVWEAAQEASRFLVTQDLDFSDVRTFRPGTHAGILPLRLPDPNRRLLHEPNRRLRGAGRGEQGRRAVARRANVELNEAVARRLLLGAKHRVEG